MKILYVTTIGSTMGFFKNFIKSLIAEGHSVDIATNECNGEFAVQSCYLEWGCKVFHIDTNRSPFSCDNFRAIRQIKKIVEDGNYNMVHCHTPLAAAATRIACKGLRKKNIKVFYTAHGFHFFKGAPLKNWMIYYPVEWICSWWTDVLITINKEDFERAQAHLHAKKTCYVPGVGIDVIKFSSVNVNRNEFRKSLGVPENCFLLTSVGEVNERKNHQVVINAIAKLNNKKIHYAIAGKGPLLSYLSELSRNLGVEHQVHLLGQRSDIPQIYKVTEVAVLPSKQEGLSVALMEAMASGCAVVCSKIRGNVDLIQNGKGGVLCDSGDITSFVEGIKHVISSDITEMGLINQRTIQNFGINRICNDMKHIYFAD